MSNNCLQKEGVKVNKVEKVYDALSKSVMGVITIHSYKKVIFEKALQILLTWSDNKLCLLKE